MQSIPQFIKPSKNESYTKEGYLCQASWWTRLSTQLSSSFLTDGLQNLHQLQHCPEVWVIRWTVPHSQKRSQLCESWHAVFIVWLSWHIPMHYEKYPCMGIKFWYLPGFVELHNYVYICHFQWRIWLDCSHLRRQINIKWTSSLVISSIFKVFASGIIWVTDTGWLELFLGPIWIIYDWFTTFFVP